MLIDAALNNFDVQTLIADPQYPTWTIEYQQRDPTVRVEYEQAIAIGDVSTCLSATRSKHWGAGPQILPVKPDDPVDPIQILYLFRENSLYNRRYEQRKRMKELLDRNYRKLVEQAKYKRCRKRDFLADISADEANAIRRILKVEPGDFWRAAKGKIFIELPPRLIQTEFDFDF